VSARLRSFGVVEKLPLTKIKVGKTKPHGEVNLYLHGRKTTAALYKREDVFANTNLKTPCIVTEYSATTLIDADSKARIDGFGNLLIECK
jgi:N-methylhydantoinase A/oxoprolinase/acetone carboxylase beta subunit